MTTNLYTTFSVDNNSISSATVQALIINSKNNAIREIVIITESKIKDIIGTRPDLNNKKIRFVRSNERPTFRDMFNEINKDLSASTCTIAILLNSDISISNEETVFRLERAINNISHNSKKVAFALTRYDKCNGGVEITLESGIGLPNVLSSDAWVFNSQITCKKDLYYSLGQMYCDKFINHDLIESGYKLYNPCLDCIVIHNEDVVKDTGYYKALGDDDYAKKSIQKHWRLSVKKGSNYYGVCRVRSVGLVAGYLPEPVSFSTSRKRLFVFMNADHSEISEYLNLLIKHSTLTAVPDLDVYIVTEHKDQHLHVETMLAKYNVNYNIYNYFVNKIDNVFDKLFKGAHDTYESIGYTMYWSFVTPDFIRLSGTVFIDMRKNKQISASQLDFHVKSNLSWWRRFVIIISGAFRTKNSGFYNNYQGNKSLAIIIYGSKPKEEILKIMSCNDVKALLFCTSRYAQNLDKKFTAELD